MKWWHGRLAHVSWHGRLAHVCYTGKMPVPLCQRLPYEGDKLPDVFLGGIK
jgi:hypothetical protein